MDSTAQMWTPNAYVLQCTMLRDKDAPKSKRSSSWQSSSSLVRRPRMLGCQSPVWSKKTLFDPTISTMRTTMRFICQEDSRRAKLEACFQLAQLAHNTCPTHALDFCMQSVLPMGFQCLKCSLSWFVRAFDWRFLWHLSVLPGTQDVWSTAASARWASMFQALLQALFAQTLSS